MRSSTTARKLTATLTTLVAIGMALPSAAHAQSWPAKPIRMLNPLPAGGSIIVTLPSGYTGSGATGVQALAPASLCAPSCTTGICTRSSPRSVRLAEPLAKNANFWFSE